MIFISSFFERIASDFRQKELLPLKLLFFVHSSTIYVLYPYLTIHMRELGINVEETAIMSAVTPIVAIIMPPIAGVIADKIGNFKVILSLFSALGGLASLLLLLVPVGRINITYPNDTILELNTAQSVIDLMVSEPHPCVKNLNTSIPTYMILQSCGVVCNRSPNTFQPYEIGPKTEEEEAKAILKIRSYRVKAQDSNGTDTYTYTLGPGDLPLYVVPKDPDVRNMKIMHNQGNYGSSVRQLTATRFFFPTKGLYSLSCSGENENLTCTVLLDKEGVQDRPPDAKELAVKLANPPAANDMFVHFPILELRPEFGNLTSWKYWEAHGVSSEGNTALSVDVPLPNKDNGLEVDATLHLDDCMPRCLVTVPRKLICNNLDHVEEFDIRLTFWIYLIIRVFIGMIGGTAFAMFEGAVIAILREHKADYGLQRIYATIGGMISSPLSGYLIDYASQDKLYTDFRPAFYLYAGMKVLSAALMLTINLEFKSPATNVLADVMMVLKKVEIIALFITCFILGTAWGYIESFLFWLLQDLGASRSLMGITITVGGIAGLPLLVMSGPIIDKIGHANVLFIGFVFYAIRLLGYSLIYNPWMCLPFEAMESITSSLSFTAAVTYAAKLSTMTTDSSVQGLLGGLYFGVGKGSGSLIGGYLMQTVGTRPTYQIFAGVTLLTGFVYFLFNYFCIERHGKGAIEKEGDVVVKWNEKAPIQEKKKYNNNSSGDVKLANHNSESIPIGIPTSNYQTNDVGVRNSLTKGKGRDNKAFEIKDETPVDSERGESR
uniref:Major facilitator superfamily domain-containing protein 6-A n=1 Tax=Lygus hesperus TaxID=30085 RepID=A0A0A9W421_LYGHE